jgi:hypothetical protein
MSYCHIEAAYCADLQIVGRKEAVEEAKRRLEAQIEKLEDETTESVNIKRAIQPALIGSGGKYAIRLEEKYGVKLSFPRDNKDGSATTKPDEVTIRGGKKGVAQAKAELLEAAAFENESRQELKFSVPSKSVAQIVGKSVLPLMVSRMRRVLRSISTRLMAMMARPSSLSEVARMPSQPPRRLFWLSSRK